jgi:hypothetical protein
MGGEVVPRSSAVIYRGCGTQCSTTVQGDANVTYKLLSTTLFDQRERFSRRVACDRYVKMLLLIFRIDSQKR